MQSVLILAIIFGGIILALAVIGGTIVMSIRIIRGGSVSSQGRKLQAEEVKIIQEIYLGLTKMEDRLEALETILLDKEGKKRPL